MTTDGPAAGSARGAAARSWGVPIVAAGALALLAALAPAGRADDVRPGGPPGEAGAWVEARIGSVPRFVPAVGNLRARRATRVGPQVSGRVAEVRVEVGDVVRAGDPLVLLERDLFEIERDQRATDLRAAEVERDEADLQWRRMRSLWEKPDGGAPSIARKLYDDARSRLDLAGARVAQFEQALRWAERRLQETTIRAPFDGVVSARLVHPGEPVNAQPVSQLVEVQETAVLDLEFALPQEMLARVARGTEVEFDVEGVPGAPRGAPTGATVVATVFPALDEATRAFRCRAYIPNAGGRLRPGLLARVRVRDGEASGVVVVPAAALAATEGGWRALVEKDGRTVARTVEVGAAGGGLVEVRRGLAAGERVLLPAGGGAGR